MRNGGFKKTVKPFLILLGVEREDLLVLALDVHHNCNFITNISKGKSRKMLLSATGKRDW
jgi:hypothetical protein